MNKGWVSLYRKTLENPIVCKDSDHLSIWVYLLLQATHAGYDSMFKGERIRLMPGQLITGRKSISSVLKVNESKVQRVLKLFENEQQIEQLMSNRNRLITITNWSTYQKNEQQIEQLVNNHRTTSEQPVNTNNNVITNNDNNMLLSLYRGENPESYPQEHFPNFYQWIEKNNYTEKAKHPNEEPYYLKYLHEKANFLSRLKGKDHVETINAIKAFEDRKATVTEEIILEAQSIREN